MVKYVHTSIVSLCLSFLMLKYVHVDARTRPHEGEKKQEYSFIEAVQILILV